jgi:hypothetical protein
VGTEGYLIGPKGKIADEPSSDLVEISFGLRKFDGRAGRYLVGYDGQPVDPRERLF